jgi:putative component of membrane protein insertase Oxa1/YidC/SpoIIIJ protein YidD
MYDKIVLDVCRFHSSCIIYDHVIKNVYQMYDKIVLDVCRFHPSCIIYEVKVM